MSRLLNIEETKQFLLKCIASCKNQEHLSLCREIIDTFIVKRFKHYAPFNELSIALSELDIAIEEQKGNIIKGVYELNNILTTTN